MQTHRKILWVIGFMIEVDNVGLYNILSSKVTDKVMKTVSANTFAVVIMLFVFKALMQVTNYGL